LRSRSCPTGCWAGNAAFAVPRAAIDAGATAVADQAGLCGKLLCVRKVSRQPTKAQVEKRLGRRVPERVWRYLSEKNYVSEAATTDHDDPIGWLGEEAGKLLDCTETQQSGEFISSRRQRRTKAFPARREAISRLLAELARQRPEVQSFRQRFLGEGLLRANDVPGWIEQRKKEETRHHAVIVSIPIGSEEGWRAGAHPGTPASSLTGGKVEGRCPVDSIDYVKPGDPSTQRLPVGRDGTLLELLNLVRLLAKAFAWHKWQATAFVLTDAIPLVRDCEISIKPPSFIELQQEGLVPLDCTTRITIEVDPAITASELAAKYLEVRARLLRRKPRPRSLAEKHICLAGFGSGYKTLDAGVLKAWNQEFPKWKYSTFKNFSRDTRMARYRLLHSSPVDPWSWTPGPSGPK
jgi:hypothetical protein